MSVFINDGGIEKEAKMIYVNDGGIDKPVLGGDSMVSFVGARSTPGQTLSNMTNPISVIPGDLALLFLFESGSLPSLPPGWTEAGRQNTGTYRVIAGWFLIEEAGEITGPSGQSGALLVFRGATSVGKPWGTSISSSSSVSIPAIPDFIPGNVVVVFSYGGFRLYPLGSVSSRVCPVPGTYNSNAASSVLCYMTTPNVESFPDTSLVYSTNTSPTVLKVEVLA